MIDACHRDRSARHRIGARAAVIYPPLVRFACRILLCSLIVFAGRAVSAQNISFYQAQFNGGVTGCGYGPDYSGSGTGTLTLSIPPGCTIYKAWLFAGREGPVVTPLTVTLGATNYVFSSGNQVSPSYISVYGGASGVHAVDVTAAINPAINTYQLTIPAQASTSNRYEDFYLYVAYANSSLPQVTSCIFLNTADFATTINDNFALTYPVNNTHSVAMACFFGYACSSADGEYVAVNGTTLGNTYGPHSNSGSCAGPFGNFSYSNYTLTGLVGGNPDQAMNGPDALSDIKALVNNCDNSISGSFTHINLDNAVWGFFFTYSGAGITSTRRDTAVCSGSPVQLQTTASGGTPVWSPTGGLSCTSCTNPVATVTTATTYVATTAGSGCASTVIDSFRITIGASVGSTLPRSICQGSSYTFGGRTLTAAGTYLDTLVSHTGCDSIVTLTLSVTPPPTHPVSASVCQGGTYTFGGRSLTAAGTYRDTVSTASGCDSIIILTLTIRPVATGSLARSICAGGSYSFNGNILTTAGTYRDTLTAVNGCDSIITLTLSVAPVAASAISRSICSGGSYSFGGQNLIAPGVYKDTLPAVNGCDSIITLTLSVLPTSSGSISRSVCTGSSYLFGGQNLTAAGTYRDTVPAANGCDSVITLTLAVLPRAATGISRSICAGSSYSFGGQNLTAAGTYRDTLTSATGCDSVVTLTLSILPGSSSARIQAICAGRSYTFGGQNLTAAGTYRDTLTGVNGCDSIITLTLTVLPNASSVISRTICTGSSYSFGGQSLTAAGTYRDTLTAANGCDSVITLILAVQPGVSSTISRGICPGSSYSFGGQTLTSSGTYRDTLTSATGCDSVVILTLSILPGSSSARSQAICAGRSYTFGGQNLTAAGTYKDTIPAANGCDSIITLTLTILAASSSAISQGICVGSSYSFDGQNLTTAGTYRDTLTAANGCDSIITLTLSVLPASSSAISQGICVGSSYYFGGQNLTTAGTYRDTLIAASGCDSIITLTLSVLPAVYGTTSQSICAGSSYSFGGRTLTGAGTYLDTLTSHTGCDSIVTLTLSVTPPPMYPVSGSVCQGGTYIFGGRSLTAAGTYSDTVSTASGCDSIIILTLTIRPVTTGSLARSICAGSSYSFGGQTLTTAGSYVDTVTAANGCDSIVTLTLTVWPVSLSTISQTICAGTSYTFGTQHLTASGTYVNTIPSVHGCDSTVTLLLTVLPTITGSLSATICDGSSYTFGGRALTVAGSYPDTITSSLGCDSIRTLTLSVLPPVVTAVSEGICSGGSLVIHGQTVTSAGIYTDTLSTVAGCDSIVTLTLSVLPLPQSAFAIEPSDTYVPQGNSITIDDQSKGADHLIWLVGGQMQSSVSAPVPVRDTGTFCIRQVAVTADGCRDSSEHCIYVFGHNIFMPNAFTPNGDGVNDYLEVYGDRTAMKQLSVNIFDRWGELVFFSNDLHFGWDGTYRGAAQEPGVFVYDMDIVYINGTTEHIKGSITLIR